MSRKRAAIIIIGNEILSGRTLDENTQQIALTLSKKGINIFEVRTIADEEAAIIKTVQELSATYDYVFTTGGIGPTHDDITAESVAKAFNLKYTINQEIYCLLRDFYLQKGQEFNEARIKMSRMPEGAKLLRSSETLAPGFNVKNVFVMAGIPKIMKAMLTSAIALLPECELMKSKSLDVSIGEGVLAKDFGELQKKYKNVEMGSYPFSGNDKIGTSLVLRSFDDRALEEAYSKLKKMITKFC